MSGAVHLLYILESKQGKIILGLYLESKCQNLTLLFLLNLEPNVSLNMAF